MTFASRQKIRADELRVGMFVDEFCGAWMNHPFWRAKFVIEDEAQLAKIRASGVAEVWIDPARSRVAAAPGGCRRRSWRARGRTCRC